MTVLIHPGFHKTATTWLQEAVFSNQKYFNSLASHDEVDAHVVRPHDLVFDPAGLKALVADRVRMGSANTADVLSSEILSGNILLGSRDSVTIANRLANAVPDAKIVFTVRSQKPITKSIYVQYLKRGGRLPLEQFLGYAPPPGYSWFDPATLEFDRLVATYAELYGKQNILVLPQELLRNRKQEYLQHLFHFAGIAEMPTISELEQASARGVSPRASGLPLIRFANRLRQTTFNPAPKPSTEKIGGAIQALGYRWRVGNVAAEARMKSVIHAVLADRYRASNARLQEYTSVDLRELGYDMPE